MNASFVLWLENNAEIEEQIVELLARNLDGMQIGDMIRELGLGPEITFKDRPGYTFNHGHHESPFNKALIRLRDAGTVIVRNAEDWGGPIFQVET